jgi:hypothetical protein
MSTDLTLALSFVDVKELSLHFTEKRWKEYLLSVEEFAILHLSCLRTILGMPLVLSKLVATYSISVFADLRPPNHSSLCSILKLPDSSMQQKDVSLWVDIKETNKTNGRSWARELEIVSLVTCGVDVLGVISKSCSNKGNSKKSNCLWVFNPLVIYSGDFLEKSGMETREEIFSPLHTYTLRAQTYLPQWITRSRKAHCKDIEHLKRFLQRFL